MMKLITFLACPLLVYAVTDTRLQQGIRQRSVPWLEPQICYQGESSALG